MIAADDIVKEARSWIGTRFLHQGRSRFGVDCVGLVICVVQALDPEWKGADNAPTTYTRRPKDGELIDQISANCLRLKRIEKGALVLMQFPKMVSPSHVALYTGEGTIVHAHSVTRHVCEVGFRGIWERDTHSFWRLPGVTP
jgi:cell wall-associated NlpC family hydrolase